MNHRIIRYSIFILIGLIAFSCRQAKYVSDGKYLHKKNKLLFETIEKGDTTYEDEYALIDDGEMFELIRPTKNKRIKLFFYNRIDTTRYANQLNRKKTKCQEKNQAILAKDSTINAERIEKAKEEGKTTYNHREKDLKPIKTGWRDWVIVKLGEAPVILDTSLVSKTTKQLDIYLYKRGFLNATVSDTIVLNEKKQKAVVTYTVIPNDPYRIDSIVLGPSFDANFLSLHAAFIRKEKSILNVGGLLDEDVLDLERENFAKYCRDEAYYGFNKNYITYEVDTNGRSNYGAIVTIHISPRAVPDPSNPDSTLYLPHHTYHIKNVTFLLHNTNELSFKNGYDNFKRRCDSLGLPYQVDGHYTLLDTLVNIDTIVTGKGTSIINKGVFVFNDVPYLDPDLLDKQNFLEIGDKHFAKEYYIERTYRTMLQLDVFSSITPIVIIDPKNPLGNQLLVTYHLVPMKRQTFTIEPRITNSNSILGIMGSVNYSNKNLFRGAQKLKISFIGGFESQPRIVDTEAGSDDQNKAWNLNTFEWGPSIQLIFPKLVPMTAKIQATSSKRAYPSTVFDLTVNFQKRYEFSRRLAHFSYEWNFKQDKTQEWKLKWVNFNFVKLDKELIFEQKLIELNDPFLMNSYSDHFSLYNQLDYHYTNQFSNTFKNKFINDFKTSFFQSGGILNASTLGSGDTSSLGLKQIFGVPFSQFLKIDNQYIFKWKINKKNTIAARALAGIGYAYGNSPSMPYEQSFFAGGSNDIRAFSARTMAPGSIRIYEDSTATTTQIGDLKLEINLEYRFRLTDMLEGAFFVDMGNIWKIKDDPSTIKDDLGVFHFNSFYQQVAIGTGLGIRADLEFLIVRLDVAFAVHNPYLPAGEKWVWQDRPTYIATWDAGPNGNNNGIIDPIQYDKDGNLISGNTTGDEKIGIYEEANNYIKPFRLIYNIGIGYPF